MLSAVPLSLVADPVVSAMLHDLVPAVQANARLGVDGPPVLHASP